VTTTIKPPIWLTSDWHLGHANVIAYDRRPFRDVADMQSEIVNRYNSRVNPGDTVLFLGDILYSGTKEEAKTLLDSMLGTKILIRGNHDRRSRKWYMDVGFSEVLKSAVIYLPNVGRVLCVHNPLEAAKHPDARYVLHGHRHSVAPMLRGKDAGWLDVGVTAWNYSPVRFDEAIAILY
jgi:calcineurin-like phosphoesterase family protein